MKLFFCFFLFLLSCNRIVDLKTNESFLLMEDLRTNDELFNSYASSIYNDLYFVFNRGANLSPNENLSYFIGALSDEFKTNVDITNITIRNSFYNNYFESDLNNYLIPDLFVPYYRIIIKCNNVMSVIDDKYVREVDRLYLEVKAIRSILYFLLFQLYGDIPLLLKDDVNDNLDVAKSNKNDILQFCIKELNEVYLRIDNDKKKINYSNISATYTQRINKDVVSYFLSLLYILNKDYDLSIEFSINLIDEYSFDNNFEKKFKLSSSENIWVLEPSIPLVTAIYNNTAASILNYKLIPHTVPFNTARPFSLSESILNKFDYNDKRRSYFIDSVWYNNKWEYLPYKYKVAGFYDLNSTERYIIIRLSTVYFNLIEALYLNGELDRALSYFNEVSRNNYFVFENLSQISLEKIIEERFKEMFAENGDRWFTLKRLGIVDEVMSQYLPIKSNNLFNWNRDRMEYLPIPLGQQLLNPKLKEH